MSFLPDGALDHLREVAETPDFSGTRYGLESEIGRGGMGVVYRAWDSQLERPVAIKVMNAGAVVKEEAKLLARVEHPGIAPVYDAGTLPDGRSYYAMRLIRGQRLDRYLRQEPSLPARLRVFDKICEAVAFAHSQGVVHCDLKPQNVLVGDYGEVFVVDWGIARHMEGADRAPAGTPPYMAPEQSETARGPIDRRTDVFALGRLLLDLMPPAAPRPLAAIAAKASQSDPAARFADVASLAADVNRFLDGQPVSAYRDSTLERLARFWRQNQVLLLLLTAYLVVKVILFLAAPALK